MVTLTSIQYLIGIRAIRNILITNVIQSNQWKVCLKLAKWMTCRVHLKNAWMNASLALTIVTPASFNFLLAGAKKWKTISSKIISHKSKFWLLMIRKKYSLTNNKYKESKLIRIPNSTTWVCTQAYFRSLRKSSNSKKMLKLSRRKACLKVRTIWSKPSKSLIKQKVKRQQNKQNKYNSQEKALN